MSTWIVRANPSMFRIHDFIRDHGFVEKIDITPDEEFDDRSYSLINKSTTTYDSDRVVRFKNIARVKTDELCYKKLLEHGFKYTMQSDRPVNKETEAYIEGFFK